MSETSDEVAEAVAEVMRREGYVDCRATDVKAALSVPAEERRPIARRIAAYAAELAAIPSARPGEPI